MGYIYILTSPNGKSYIGQTTRPIEKRFQQHQQKSSGCVAIYNAIQKYGWENFEKDYYECPDEDLNFDEDLLVREMGTLAPNGYNLREGGGNNGKMSDETKQKMSESKKGDKHSMFGKTWSEEIKQKNSESHFGKTHAGESKKKMSEARVGKTHAEKTKQKMSEAKIGKTLSEETKQKISESKRGEKHPMYGKPGEKHHSSKKVYQYDLEGNILGSFGSGREAARHLKKKDSSIISKCALGERKTAYGFVWMYTNHQSSLPNISPSSPEYPSMRGTDGSCWAVAIGGGAIGVICPDVSASTLVS
jgi:hypothetical protein